MSSPDETLDVEGSARFGIDGKLTINSRTTGLARFGIDGNGPEVVALQTTIDDKKIGYDVSTYGAGDIRHILSLQPDGGRVGIGTMTASSQFQVGNSGDGSVARANAWTTFSDRRWKTKIILITDALDKLHSINGYTYKWKEGADTSTQVGVIAQEIEAVLPEAVKTDENGYKSVDYGKLSALLIEAVKEQQTIITSLENKIQEQNTTIMDVQSVQKSLDERLLILEKK
jgi:hypothetical protein